MIRNQNYEFFTIILAACMFVLGAVSPASASWYLETVAAVEHSFGYLKTLIDKNDVIHMVYNTGPHFLFWHDCYFRKTASGWSEHPLPVQQGSWKTRDIAMNDESRLHLCYAKNNAVRLAVLNDDDSWSETEIAATCAQAQKISLSADDRGCFHAAYTVDCPNDIFFQSAFYLTFDGVSWNQEIITERIFLFQIPFYISNLILNSCHSPGIIIMDVNDIWIYQRNQGDWISERVPTAGCESISTEFVCVANGPGGVIRVLFRDSMTRQLLLATRKNAIWTVDVIGEATSDGKSSMVIDTIGTTHILYWSKEQDESELRYSCDMSGVWVTETICRQETIYEANLVLDNRNKPNVFYSDGENVIHAVKIIPDEARIPRKPNLSVNLEVERMCYTAGDVFSLEAYLGSGTVHRGSVPLVIALDCMGVFYFWPSWRTEFDFRVVDLHSDGARITAITPFIWPNSNPALFGEITFYGAFLSDDLSEIIGDRDIVNICYQ